jgi:hypothetical protein
MARMKLKVRAAVAVLAILGIVLWSYRPAPVHHHSFRKPRLFCSEF